MKTAIVAVWIIAGISLAIDVYQEVRMKTLLVSVELTDAQYAALDRLAKQDAQDEASLIASAAVTTAADRELKRIADENMPRQGGFVGKETGDAEYAALVEEAEAIVDESTQLIDDVEELVTDMSAKVDAAHLTASGGVFYGPSGKEKWYNADMSNVVEYMQDHGFPEDSYPYHVREDGVKCIGDYILVAADTTVRPKGTILETSLGVAVVADHCVEAEKVSGLVDIAVDW